MKRIPEVMRAIHAPWIFVLCWAMCGPLQAIDRDRRLDQFYHTAWAAKDGAPTFVRTWAQMPDGFLWFGGPNGLYRFDGAKYVSASGKRERRLAFGAGPVPERRSN